MTGSTNDIERARRDADRARRQLAYTIGALQHRLRPANLMSSAWDGVKEKSGAVADGAIEAVKARPVMLSGVVAAVALFAAREPIRALISDFVAQAKAKSPGKREGQRAPAPETRKRRGIATSAEVATTRAGAEIQGVDA